MSLGWGVRERPRWAEKCRVPVGRRRQWRLRFLQVSLTQTFQSGCWLQAPSLFLRLEHRTLWKARGMAACLRSCLAHNSTSYVALLTTGETDDISDAFPARSL